MHFQAARGASATVTHPALPFFPTDGNLSVSLSGLWQPQVAGESGPARDAQAAPAIGVETARPKKSWEIFLFPSADHIFQRLPNG